MSRKRWTLKDCTVMEEAGVLTSGEYELLNRVIVPKVGQFRPHMTGCKRAFLAPSLIFGTDYVLLPMTVSVDEENGPEPDVAVTRFSDSHYAGRNDQPTEDLQLVMEVSVSTLWRDRNTKMVLYAQAGVPEHWVLDVNRRTLWAHTNPTSTGYATIQELNDAASVLPQAAPSGSAPVTVTRLLS